jgi:hypothetical protein
MKKYIKIYMDAFGYDEGDFIPSEISEAPAVDIHHIDCKGAGGSKQKDYIENLMAVTRAEHIEYGDITELKPMLKEIHRKRMDEAGVKYNPKLL